MIRARDARSASTRRALSSSISDVAARPSSTVESASSTGSWTSAATVWPFRVSHVTPRSEPSSGTLTVAPSTSTKSRRSGDHRTSLSDGSPSASPSNSWTAAGVERLSARSHRDLTEADRGEHVAADLAGENRERNRDGQEAARDPERRVQTERGGIEEPSYQEHDHARDEHSRQRRDRAAPQTARGPDLRSSNIATPIAETANRMRTAVPSAVPVAAWPPRICSAFGGQR